MNKQCFYNQFPVLDLGKIILRNIKQSDAQQYFDYMSRAEIKKTIAKEHIPQTFNESLNELKYWSGLFTQKSSIYWAIALTNTNEIIGTIGFNIISFLNESADISYDLNPNYWGKGFMSKSIISILDFADNNLELSNIRATVITDNSRSIKILEKNNFKQKELMKNYEIVNGKNRDYYLYVRTATK